MKGTALLAFALAIVSMPTASAGQTNHPPEVRAYFDKARAECRQAGSQLRVSSEDSHVQQAEFNGDGRPDYVIELASLYCPPMGLTEHCGSAGCNISILVSSGTRMREVWNGNLQGYAVSAPVKGRQSIHFAEHGTFCGNKSGADTCYGTMRWTAKGWTKVRTRAEPLALSADGRREQREADASQRDDKDTKYNWVMVAANGDRKGPAGAMSNGLPGRPRTAVGCARGMPVLIMQFGPAASAPPAATPFVLMLGDARPEAPRATVAMLPMKGAAVFIGQLSNAALRLMRSAANDSYPFMMQAWTISGRDYWIELPGLTLTNFNTTAATVVASCARGRRR